MMGLIHFFNENCQFVLRKKKLTIKWIKAVVKAENFGTGEINIVFCDDEYLSRLNFIYLKHNTLTDILSFPYSDVKEIIQGDIFISIERVRENAINFKVKFEDELRRVIIHGILHFLGYRDSTKKEKDEMRQKESVCLLAFEEMVRETK